MYHSPKSTHYKHTKSTNNHTFTSDQLNDPLRQQLTSYLSRFRDKSVPSNLLVTNTKNGLPTLYAKARKYSVFTLKRKPNRSYNLSPSHHRMELLPALHHLK